MTSRHLPAIRPPTSPAVSLPRAQNPALEAEDAGPDWRRLLAGLWRFKWLIVLAGGLGLGGGVASTRFFKPAYVAQATVWIDVPDRRGGAPDRTGPIRAGGLLDSDAWIDLLRSYVVLDHVVRDQRLYLDLKAPDDSALFSSFGVQENMRSGAYRLRVDDAGGTYTLSAVGGGATGRTGDLETGTVGDSIGARLGFVWKPAAGALPPGHAVEFTLLAPRDAARRLGDELQVQMDQNGNFLTVELRGPSPRRIAAILNAVTTRYVQVAADLKRQKLTELMSILDEQLRYAQVNLSDAEARLRTFRVQTITLPSERSAGGGTSTAAGTGGAEERDPAFTSFFERQVDREQARRDRETIERLLRQSADSGVPASALGVVGAVTRDAELSQALKELTDKQADLRSMLRRYSDAYPPVQRATAEIAELEHHTIPALAQALVTQLAARERDLGRDLEASSRQLKEIPARSIEEARLRRGVSLAEETYTTVQNRYTEAKLAAEASGVPDVRVLDPAVAPQRPVKNTAPSLLFMGLLGGLGVGCVLSILLDRIDPRVRYPEQVSRDLGLPIIGAVPHLRPREEPSGVVEALRGVCFNLVHAHGGAGPLLLTITSPGAGDGKSFIAANLAVTFADGGHRTLLVDGDMRRGTLHRRFGRPRQPGLSDYLNEEAAREQVIQATTYPLLHVVGCGTRMHRAPELLGAPAMGDLIAAARSQYDVVLVDSPPLAAGVDPFVLGTATGNLLLVLRTGYSHRDVVGVKLEMLSRLPIRILGAVLNAVPRGAGYYYYAYYSYDLPGYEAKDEDPERGARPRLV